MRSRPRRPRRLATAFAVGLVVTVTAAGLVWGGPHADHPAQAGPSRRTAAPVTPAPSGSQPAGPSVPPAVSLAGLRWVAFYGIELPVSPSAGPRHRRDGLARGFTDTPLGALLAAVNIGVRANAQWGPGIFGPTIRKQVTGPAKAVLLSGCQSSYQQERSATGVPDGRPLGRAYVTEEAFRWVSYSPAAASVDLVSAGPGSQGTTVRAVTQVSLTWSGTDWQVIAPLGGDWGNSAAPLASLTGYTRFPLPPA